MKEYKMMQDKEKFILTSKEKKEKLEKKLEKMQKMAEEMQRANEMIQIQNEKEKEEVNKKSI